MSSFVNKVKEVLHSANDTPSEPKPGKLDLLPEERERLEAAGYGSSHKAEKQHVGATDDITTAPGGHPPSHYLQHDKQETSTIPGAFPGSGSTSDQDNKPTHHKDGREYVAPRGSHVGQTETQAQSQSQVQTSQQSGVSDRHLMDPADRSTGSNIMGDSAVSGANTKPSQTTVGAGALAGTEALSTESQSTGPNKLHKRGDPRGHVGVTESSTHGGQHDVAGAAGTYPQTSIQTAQSIPAHGGQHGVVGTTGVHPQSGTQTAQSIPAHRGQHDVVDTTGVHSQSGTQTAQSLPARGNQQGVVGTVDPYPRTDTRTTQAMDDTYGAHAVAGDQHQSNPPDMYKPTTGSTIDSTDHYDQQASRGYADSSATPNYSYPTITSGTNKNAAPTATTIGVPGMSASQLDGSKHHDDKSSYTISNNQQSHQPASSPVTNTTSGASHPRGQGVYNTVIGAGSSDDPHGHHASDQQTFDSHPGITSASHATPREAGDSHITGGYGTTATTALGAGTTGITSQYHTSNQQDQGHDLATTTTSTSGAPSSYQSGTTALPSRSAAHNAGTSSTSNAPLPATLTSSGIGATHSGSASNPSATYGTSSNTSSTRYPTSTYTNTNTATSSQGNAGGTGILTNPTSTGTSSEPHHGPGYPGAKVVHTCTKCGEDNDISHYFGKQAIYRLSQ